MKVIIAPDSFKGSLRSPEVCIAIEAGIRSVMPDAEIISVPMADGGEGTAEAAVISTGGSLEQIIVAGPLGTPVNACYGLSGGKSCAIMEMASASGIELLTAEQLNPLKTSTYGTGEIIRGVLRKGIQEIIIGIGGSATVDGGAGMAQALGFRFFDVDGRELPPGIGGGELGRISRIDCSTVEPLLKTCRIKVACDVTNPLLGANGAARIFGPQKGATPEMVELLERNLAHYAEVLKQSGLCSGFDNPGDGAAGGMGFALRVFAKAQMVSGAALMIGITGLESHLKGADLLITGEGCSDSQTANGKLCAVVAEAAQRAGVPAVLLSGAVSGGAEVFRGLFAGAFSIATGPCTLQEAIGATRQNLFSAAANVAGLYKAAVSRRAAS
ncbi:MAG: glycerate kinase [Victivallaceae bacterium]|jgi:glycerate kinase